MRPTETPAYRPTAASIWNSFLSSGKRHLILTGGRGTGKSTAINPLRTGMPGIITCAVPQTGVCMQQYPEGSKVQIGVFDPSLLGPENRMRPLNTAFEEHAVPMLRKLAEEAGEWVFVDEIGYLEYGSEAYMNALRNLFDRKRVIAAVRKQDVPFLLELRERKDAFCVDLDSPFGNTGCVIMASGLSKRFGSNKLLADFHGEPLFNRILSATEGIFSRRTVVTRHPEIAEICKTRGIDVVLHTLPHRSDTVRLGLEAIGAVERCMFCAADQPLLRKETIASLVLASSHDTGSIWRPSFGENSGSPVLFPEWAFEQLMNLPEGKGGSVIAKKHPEMVRTIPVQDEYELMDADDREAFERLLNIGLER